MSEEHPNPTPWERIRRANAPKPPEDSVSFRVATGASVIVGLVAVMQVGEIRPPAAFLATIAVAIGMVFSYLTRRQPWQWLKILLALAVIGVFTVFVRQVLGAAHTGQLDSVEVPLAGLFTWVQVIHAFDVPARRDLLFSLAAGAALITIAGAQAVSISFALLVLAWLVSTIVGLACAWGSTIGLPAPPRLGRLVGTTVLVLAVGGALFVLLPEPRPERGFTLPSSLMSYLPLAGSSIVNGSGPDADEPAQPGRPGGQLGVGGFEGFDDPLDTADRASLGDEVIMRVRADRPGYFVGTTYDSWDGQSWTEPRDEKGTTLLTGGSPFEIPQGDDADSDSVSTNVQTFYVTRPLPNLLFSTADPTEVYFPSRSLILTKNGSILSTVAVTAGTVYTVISSDDEVPPRLLARDTTRLPPVLEDDPPIRDALQLPHPYPRVAHLARHIVATARAHSLEGIVTALEGWIGTHTRYSTDIPPLRPGEDAVDEFLFGNRRGYCEQISTALAIMLRTLGVPAREVVGYVPGPFDPLSDLYDIEAKDAHAWVQVYFPHYGWQNFDPTAQVPLAPESTAGALAAELGSVLSHLPWLPIGATTASLAIASGLLAVRRRHLRRPASWEGRLACRLERIGRRAGLARKEAETLLEFGRRLERASSLPLGGSLICIIEAAAYSERGRPTSSEAARAEEAVRTLARAFRRRHRTAAGAIRRATHPPRQAISRE